MCTSFRVIKEKWKLTVLSVCLLFIRLIESTFMIQDNTYTSRETSGMEQTVWSNEVKWKESIFSQRVDGKVRAPVSVNIFSWYKTKLLAFVN